MCEEEPLYRFDYLGNWMLSKHRRILCLKRTVLLVARHLPLTNHLCSYLTCFLICVRHCFCVFVTCFLPPADRCRISHTRLCVSQQLELALSYRVCWILISDQSTNLGESCSIFMPSHFPCSQHVSPFAYIPIIGVASLVELP